MPLKAETLVTQRTFALIHAGSRRSSGEQKRQLPLLGT